MNTKSEQLSEQESEYSILIAEDDPDQMNLLVDFALGEIRKLFDAEAASDEQRQKIRNIKIIPVNSIASLEKAVRLKKTVLLAILDCNMPDAKGGVAHDQFIKTKYKITGQHRSVDIVTENLPGTPVTMISSLNRFKKIVSQYYKTQHDININYIGKNDELMIKRNIGYYLRQYLKVI